jgi:predicted RNA-binding protein with PUA-like domain
MQYWLLKSEPSEFGIDDLEKVGEQVWDGVRNYQVRNAFRDVMKVGDLALFYHSSCKEVGVVGEMEVVLPAVVDKTQFAKNSKYYDPKSNKDSPRWLGPRVRFISKFNRPVPLSEIRLDPRFSSMTLLKRGNRLSAFLITKSEYQALVKLGKSQII